MGSVVFVFSLLLLRCCGCHMGRLFLEKLVLRLSYPPFYLAYLLLAAVSPGSVVLLLLCVLLYIVLMLMMRERVVMLWFYLYFTYLVSTCLLATSYLPTYLLLALIAATATLQFERERF